VVIGEHENWWAYLLRTRYPLRQSSHQPLDFVVESLPGLCRLFHLPVPSHALEFPSGLDNGLRRENIGRAFEGVGGVMELVRLAVGNGCLNVGHQFRSFLKECLCKRFGAAAQTFLSRSL
jgi:hypothetical protein